MIDSLYWHTCTIYDFESKLFSIYGITPKWHKPSPLIMHTQFNRRNNHDYYYTLRHINPTDGRSHVLTKCVYNAESDESMIYGNELRSCHYGYATIHEQVCTTLNRSTVREELTERCIYSKFIMKDEESIIDSPYVQHHLLYIKHIYFIYLRCGTNSRAAGRTCYADKGLLSWRTHWKMARLSDGSLTCEDTCKHNRTGYRHIARHYMDDADHTQVTHEPRFSSACIGVPAGTVLQMGNMKNSKPLEFSYNNDRQRELPTLFQAGKQYLNIANALPLLFSYEQFMTCGPNVLFNYNDMASFKHINLCMTYRLPLLFSYEQFMTCGPNVLFNYNDMASFKHINLCMTLSQDVNIISCVPKSIYQARTNAKHCTQSVLLWCMRMFDDDHMKGQLYKILAIAILITLCITDGISLSMSYMSLYIISYLLCYINIFFICPNTELLTWSQHYTKVPNSSIRSTTTDKVCIPHTHSNRTMILGEKDTKGISRIKTNQWTSVYDVCTWCCGHMIRNCLITDSFRPDNTLTDAY